MIRSSLSAGAVEGLANLLGFLPALPALYIIILTGVSGHAFFADPGRAIRERCNSDDAIVIDFPMHMP